MARVTPYQLNLMLHYYSSSEDYPWPAPILEDELETLCGLELLKRGPTGGAKYLGTEKLYCFIKHICNLPLPEWRMP